MEEFKNEKNSAIEKVENIANGNGKKKSGSPSKKSSSVKSEKGGNTKKSTKKGKTSKKSTAKIKQERKAERERKAQLKLEKRERKERERKQKNEKIKKAKLAKREAQKRKQEELKKLALIKREERLKRRELLKHESKEEREKRISAEKQAKMKLKADRKKAKLEAKRERQKRKAEYKKQKQERKAEYKRVKQERKAERRKTRDENKAKNKREKRQRGIGGWLAAVISLGCAVLVLGSLLTLSMFTDYINIGGNVNSADNTSARAFYDFVGYIDNIETNLSKFFVSSDNESRQKILNEITTQSSLADASLAQIPIMDESKYLTSKYVNQVGDYAKYLSNRLLYGEDITDRDYEGLVELYNVNASLKNTLSGLSQNIDQTYDFSSLQDNNANDLIIAEFNDIEENTMNYPEMIYDGPFSDEVQGKKALGISGEEITEMQAIEIFKETFKDYGLGQVEVVGMTENGDFNCYNLSSKTEDGREFFASYTKTGGKLALFNAYKDCKEEVYGEEQCVEIAKEFLDKIGYKGMTCVWNAVDGATEHLNFAYEQDGIIIYPDLIKVNVCRESGKVTGIDADGYLLNHTDRKLDKARYSVNEAEEKLNEGFEVETKGTVVIPEGNQNEKLCYEFIGNYNGSKYYIYIDANTLKEADIFKVIETEEGLMLI